MVEKKCLHSFYIFYSGSFKVYSNVKTANKVLLNLCNGVILMLLSKILLTWTFNVRTMRKNLWSWAKFSSNEPFLQFFIFISAPVPLRPPWPRAHSVLTGLFAEACRWPSRVQLTRAATVHFVATLWTVMDCLDPDKVSGSCWKPRPHKRVSRAAKHTLVFCDFFYIRSAHITEAKIQKRWIWLHVKYLLNDLQTICGITNCSRFISSYLIYLMLTLCGANRFRNF